jgi:uncharacterized protein YeeX (DUF496 family)
MGKKKQIGILLDEDQLQWLENKVEEEGYSKDGLIRVAIKRLMEDHTTGKTKEADVKSLTSSQQSDTEAKEPPKIEFDTIIEVILKMGDEGKLDDFGVRLPEMLESARHIQQRLKNIESMSPRAAFELAVFKTEIEFKFGYAMHARSNGTTKVSVKGRSWAKNMSESEVFQCHTI